MEQKTINIHFRVSENEKEIIDKALKILNQQTNKKVGYRFLTLEKAKEIVKNTNSGLEFKKAKLLKEIEKEKETEAKARHNISLLEIELNNINTEINNKTLFNIQNYPYDKPLNKGYERLKDIVLNPDNNINVFEDITETTFKQMQQSFKIKDLELFKEIIKNDFQEWQQEKAINQEKPTEKTYKEKLETLMRLFERAYKSEAKKFKNDKLKFLEHNKERYKTMCEKDGVKFNDFENEIINSIDK